MRHPAWYLVCAAALLACGRDRRGKRPDSSIAAAAYATAAASPPASRAFSPAAAEVARPQQSVWSGQKLIRSADFRIQVDDVGASMREIDRIVALRDALIADSRAERAEKGIPSAQMLLRVPAKNLAPLLSDLRALGTVKNESTRGDDVNGEYGDLETRITVKQETVDRIRFLLAERTGKLPEVLAAERELERVVTELEQLKGQRRSLDDRVDDATVAVQLFDGRILAAPGFGSAVTDALRKSLNALEGAVAQLIYFGVFLAPWVVLALLGWRAAKRWRRVTT